MYRSDADKTHTPMFHQIEGLVIDENINFGHLKSEIMTFIDFFFGPDTKLGLDLLIFPLQNLLLKWILWIKSLKIG